MTVDAFHCSYHSLLNHFNNSNVTLTLIAKSQKNVKKFPFIKFNVSFSYVEDLVVMTFIR